MRLSPKYLVLLPLLATLGARAQPERDFAQRTNIGIQIPFSKQTEIAARYRLKLFDNASRFQRSMWSVEITQDLPWKGFKAGGEYRFYTTEEMDYHRFQAFLRYSHKLNRWTPSLRLQFQQKQDYFDETYLQYHPPDRVWRQRLQLKYEVDKKLELYGFAEFFQQMEPGNYNFYRVRYAIGLDYSYKKRHQLNLELFYNDEFHLKRPEDVFTVDVSYYFKLRRLDKKKKSKPTDTATDTTKP